MLNIIVSGIGNTGKEIIKCIKETQDLNIYCGISKFDLNSKDYDVYTSFKDIDGKADVIIDFSNPGRLDELLEYALSTKTPLVIGTTGYLDTQNERIKEASNIIPIFKSSNTSIGVTVMLQLVKEATKLLENFDIEIIEKHHNKKEDCPCGTAYMTADVIKEVRTNLKNIYGREGRHCKRDKGELGIHTIRGGTIIGENQVIFAGDEEVLEIKHTAESNVVFAKGSIKACKYIVNKESGLYNMNDVLNDQTI